MEDGGCAVLFRSPRSRLLGVPNALLGVMLYVAARDRTRSPTGRRVAPLRHDAARRGDERRPRLQPDHPQAAVPHLLDRTPCQRHPGGDCSGDCSACRWKRDCSASASARPQADDPDALYSSARTSPARSRPEQIWAGRLAKDRERLRVGVEAGAGALLARHARRRSRRARRTSKPGIAAGRAAIALAPDKPEGHFWVAANMGALAESFGLRQGLKYRGDDQGRTETVLRLDPAFSRDPPIARSAAGTSRCRACSAAATRSRKSTCASR